MRKVEHTLSSQYLHALFYPHIDLLDKIDAVCIKGMLYKIFRSKLINRKQFVVLNDCKSQCTVLSAGDPQDSVLGPLFF